MTGAGRSATVAVRPSTSSRHHINKAAGGGRPLRSCDSIAPTFLAAHPTIDPVNTLIAAKRLPFEKRPSGLRVVELKFTTQIRLGRQILVRKPVADLVRR
jgi:hypothetical protein